MGCHDIAEILLKVTLKHQKSINQSWCSECLSTLKLWVGFQQVFTLLRCTCDGYNILW
jgi:hypothetical protein